jgi:hypothetical protein
MVFAQKQKLLWVFFCGFETDASTTADRVLRATLTVAEFYLTLTGRILCAG